MALTRLAGSIEEIEEERPTLGKPARMGNPKVALGFKGQPPASTVVGEFLEIGRC